MRLTSCSPCSLQVHPPSHHIYRIYAHWIYTIVPTYNIQNGVSPTSWVLTLRGCHSTCRFSFLVPRRSSSPSYALSARSPLEILHDLPQRSIFYCVRSLVQICDHAAGVASVRDGCESGLAGARGCDGSSQSTWRVEGDEALWTGRPLG